MTDRCAGVAPAHDLRITPIRVRCTRCIRLLFLLLVSSYPRTSSRLLLRRCGYHGGRAEDESTNTREIPLILNDRLTCCRRLPSPSSASLIPVRCPNSRNSIHSGPKSAPPFRFATDQVDITTIRSQLRVPLRNSAPVLSRSPYPFLSASFSSF